MLTQEAKKQICELYSDRNNKAGDIAAKYHITNSHLVQIITEAGMQPRNPKGTGARKKTAAKHCPKCHKKIDVPRAKFCCFCGADIRDECDLLIEKNEKLLNYLTLLPASVRDTAQATIFETINYFKKGR